MANVQSDTSTPKCHDEDANVEAVADAEKESREGPHCPKGSSKGQQGFGRKRKAAVATTSRGTA